MTLVWLGVDIRDLHLRGFDCLRVWVEKPPLGSLMIPDKPPRGGNPDETNSCHISPPEGFQLADVSEPDHFWICVDISDKPLENKAFLLLDTARMPSSGWNFHGPES